MTELKGIKGYFAALAEPDDWEALDGNGKTWRGVAFWSCWDFFQCATTTWRRRAGEPESKQPTKEDSMTELKGLEGYIAALRDPEQWEAWNSGGVWRGNENWRYWNADVCTDPEQRWRRKPMVAEGEVR